MIRYTTFIIPAKVKVTVEQVDDRLAIDPLDQMKELYERRDGFVLDAIMGDSFYMEAGVTPDAIVELEFDKAMVVRTEDVED